MKIKKRILFPAITTLMLGSITLMHYPTNVSAVGTQPTYDTFVMQYGASVRLKENSNGLRFAAEISENEYTDLKSAGAKFGMLIVAKDLLKGVDFTPETVFGDNSPFYFSNKVETAPTGKKAMLHISAPTCLNVDEDPAIEITGAIVDIQTANFTRSFVGVAYVALPNGTDETTGEPVYSYHFAPYYDNDINNNTRCMYYVAQAEIEDGKNVDALNELYINPFALTDRYTNYHYAYKVNHHYLHYNKETDSYSHIYTHQTTHYAQLNSIHTAEPIVKPEDTGEPDMEGNFVYDVEKSTATRTGLIYAGGMQVFDLYYEHNDEISEDKMHTTVEELLADFLDVKKADVNFGLTIDQTGNDGNWIPEPVKDGQGNVVGIDLHTENPGTNKTLILSKEFFTHLHAYGVETVTFTLDTGEGNNNKIRYAIYGADGTYLPVYDEYGEDQLSSDDVRDTRVMIKIKDIHERGSSVRIEMHNSASSSDAHYTFRDVVFGFIIGGQNLSV